MTDAPYILAGYLVTAVAVAGYAIRVVARGRRLSSQVPGDRRRWT